MPGERVLLQDRLEVAELDTATALRVSELVIAALHTEFGPPHLASVQPDRA